MSFRDVSETPEFESFLMLQIDYYILLFEIRNVLKKFKNYF
jgi:hypothetical protein